MKSCILLSTYNGAKFVSEQIASLGFQSSKPDLVVVRDDGSTDNTIDIVSAALTKTGIPFFIEQGENIGPEMSFRRLFHLGLSTDSDIFFFCDQDDIWHESKISRFLVEFDNVNYPMVVFSRYTLVDEGNVEIGLSSIPKKIGFGNSVLQNIVTGCVSACNRACLEKASVGDIVEPVMHDRWIYLLGTAFGEVKFIDYASVRYRQHSSNVVGAATSFYGIIIRRIRKFKLGARKERLRVIYLLLKHHGELMRSDDYSLCVSLINAEHSFLARLKLIFSNRCWRQNLFDNVLWRVLLMFGRV